MVTDAHAVGAHYGLKDWLVQRMTAVVMAGYTLLVLGIVLWNGGIDYALWTALFAQRRVQGRDVPLHGRAALSRLDRRARHLDGLREARRRAPRAAGALALALVAYLGWTIQILWGARTAA